MAAPHNRKQLRLDDFQAWLGRRGATLAKVTNEYEIIRYKMWVPADKARPSTHIIYCRKNGSLTYTGNAREHYEVFCDNEKRAATRATSTGGEQ